jgi:A/G-specific adenine glycosylase
MMICKARQAGTQEHRPVLKSKKLPPHFVQVAAIVVRRGRVLLAKRPSKGLLGGMWEFPNGRVNGDLFRGLATALKTGYRLKVRRKEGLETVNHAYSHFSVTVFPFICELISIDKGNDLRWVRMRELDEYPMGRIDRLIARQVQRTKSEE